MISLLLFLAPLVTDTIPSDTLTAQVASQQLIGETHDLSTLWIATDTLQPGFMEDDPGGADELVIIKKGKVTARVGSTIKTLGPGGVILFSTGQKFKMVNRDSAPVYFYRFIMHSRSPIVDTSRAGHPVLIDWSEMTMKKTDKGESRQIFDQPGASLSRIDIHATTLNPGEVSHPPHTHRAEEIILMRSGNVQMYIDGKHYPAKGGDIVFLSSGIPHALENKGGTRCEYFALQWAQ